jgi:hypothetical protein
MGVVQGHAGGSPVNAGEQILMGIGIVVLIVGIGIMWAGFE